MRVACVRTRGAGNAQATATCSPRAAKRHHPGGCCVDDKNLAMTPSYNNREGNDEGARAWGTGNARATVPLPLHPKYTISKYKQHCGGEAVCTGVTLEPPGMVRGSAE